MRVNDRDQWFLLKSKQIAVYEGLQRTNSLVQIKARKLKSQEDFYTTPIKSSLLNIFKGKDDCIDKVELINFEDVYAKMFKIPLIEENYFVFIPEKHTYI